jgi:hypothetical protein
MHTVHCWKSVACARSPSRADWGSGEPQDLGELRLEHVPTRRYQGPGVLEGSGPFYEQLARRLELAQAAGQLGRTAGGACLCAWPARHSCSGLPIGCSQGRRGVYTRLHAARGMGRWITGPDDWVLAHARHECTPSSFAPMRSAHATPHALPPLPAARSGCCSSAGAFLGAVELQGGAVHAVPRGRGGSAGGPGGCHCAGAGLSGSLRRPPTGAVR